MSAWILLRGLTREARHWGEFPEQFQHGLGITPTQVLTPDLPGNGRRWQEPSPTTVAAAMQAVRQEVLAAGHQPPFNLLGLSLGGMVTLAWATAHPDECRALVMLSSSLKPWHPLHWRLRPQAWPVLLTLLSTASPERREAAILRLTSARADELSGILPDWIAHAREHPVSRANALRQLLAAARFKQTRKPQAPLLLLAGARDNMVDPRCSQTLAAAWGADFALHPTAGHDLPLDAGDWVAAQVRAWGRG